MSSVIRLGLAAFASLWTTVAGATDADPPAPEAEVALAEASTATEGEQGDVPLRLASVSVADADPVLRPFALALALEAPPAPAPPPRLDLDVPVRFEEEIERWGDPANRTPPAYLELKAFGVLSIVAVGTLGVIALLPEDFSKWKASDDVWSDVQSNVERAWTRAPVWDEDEWAVNYIGHPVAGMFTYLSVRNLGAGRTRSFLFSTMASFAWEYVAESWAEQPSIQDLLTTSTLGSLLGEAMFQLTRVLLRGGLRGWEKVVLTVVNPIYVIEHGYK